MKISVITPSLRMDGLNVVQKGLERQTFPPDSFEWLVESGLISQGHQLNKAYNNALKRAKGTLIVSLQDFILIQPDYLEKFWDAHVKYPNAFITAPVGKVDNLNYITPAKWDWRASRNDDNETIRDCNWDCWEIDSGCAPLAALKQIGGFDEALDGHWSGDNVNVGKRAKLEGFEFKCLFDNPSLAYDHDLTITHPYRASFDGTFNNKRMVMFEGGMRINYL